MICPLPLVKRTAAGLASCGRTTSAPLPLTVRLPLSRSFPGARGVLDGLRKVDGDTAKYALDNKLVDQLGSSAEIEKALTKQFGWSKEDKNYSAISMYDYAAKKPDDSGDSIAVVFANGAIMDGEETPGNVGGDTTASQIRDARPGSESEGNCPEGEQPGGSVSASEVIRAELAAARRRQAGSGLDGRHGGFRGVLDLDASQLHRG